MWSLSETVCYVLNLRGRHALRRTAAAERERHTPALLERYRTVYGLAPDTAAFYINRAGTFLNRYALAAATLKKDFPPDFFGGKTVLEIGSGRGPFVLVLARELGAARVYGVEIEPAMARFARDMLADHQAVNATILAQDMKSVPDVSSGSVDQIISYAAFEHIHDLRAVIAEAARVLKPGGQLFARFAPIWRHYYGSHIGREIPFPWTHLLFSEPTVRKTLERLQGRSQTGVLYQGLNKLTLKQYRRIFRAAQLEILKFSQMSSSPLLRALRLIPALSEFYAGDIHVVLQKPRSARHWA